MIPEELRKRRERLGLTQAELAGALDVHPNTLAKWERGDQPMRFPRVLRFMLERMADDRASIRDDAAFRAHIANWLTADEESPRPA